MDIIKLQRRYNCNLPNKKKKKKKKKRRKEKKRKKKRRSFKLLQHLLTVLKTQIIYFTSKTPQNTRGTIFSSKPPTRILSFYDTFECFRWPKNLWVLLTRNARAFSGVLLEWHKYNFFDSKIASMPSKMT
jgi:hypothetical protein